MNAPISIVFCVNEAYVQHIVYGLRMWKHGGRYMKSWTLERGKPYWLNVAQRSMRRPKKGLGIQFKLDRNLP